MSLTSGLLAVTGVLAILYGAALLWSASTERKDLPKQDWMNSDEVRGSKFNNLQHLKYLVNPSRPSISFNRSKGRGYAMLAIGLVLLIFAFT